MTKTRVSLLYFSGAGGTRLVAELLAEILTPELACEVMGIDDPRCLDHASSSDFLVFCYPTYFLKPAPSMQEFIDKLGPFTPPRFAYAVTTYELYCENSLRSFALSAKKRGVTITGVGSIRAPGSDLTCVLPSWLCRWLYRFERRFPRKLSRIARDVQSLAARGDPRELIPATKWYTPFTQLFQVLILNRFENIKYSLRMLPERCTSCGACVKDCAREAWQKTDHTFLHVPERCELCTRCIHRCPRKAIVLMNALKDNPRLDARLYARLKVDAREKLTGGAI